MELLRASLRMAVFAYKLYVERVAFQPDGSKWLSELQSVELQKGRKRAIKLFASRARGAS